MNAKELHNAILGHQDQGDCAMEMLANQPTILRALRLLAAAEANDGSTPECRAEQELYANSNGEHAAWELAERFERKCTGLATRVLELERVELYAVHLTCEVVRAISDDGLCGREIDEILSNALAEQPAGFAAARSK